VDKHLLHMLCPVFPAEHRDIENDKLRGSNMSLNTHKLGVIVCAAAMLQSAGTASAQSITYLPELHFASDLSFDGSVATGNIAGPYEPFIWTPGDGVEVIGGATLPVIGVGAGSPDISHDGTRVSASIIDQTGMYLTLGYWESGTWSSVIEVGEPGTAILDANIGSAWALSGDGQTVGGLIWAGGSEYGNAKACTWSANTGLVILEVDPDRSARVNALNYDGTIAAGWEERPDGAWQPTVWRDGVKMRLSPNDAFTGCEQMNSSGDIVVGSAFEPSTQNRVATIWRWDGTEYVEQKLPLLPGTPAFNGWAVANSVSDDGAIVVGTNYYSFNPGGTADGIVWTQDTGLVNAMDYFTSIGFVFESTIDIIGVYAVSPDGSTFIADYFNARNGQVGSVILRVEDECTADLNNDGALNFFDVSTFLGLFQSQDPSADYTGDGLFDFFDVSAFLSAFNAGCP
jgi:uncharacterized membrane protein